MIMAAPKEDAAAKAHAEPLVSVMSFVNKKKEFWSATFL